MTFGTVISDFGAGAKAKSKLQARKVGQKPGGKAAQKSNPHPARGTEKTAGSVVGVRPSPSETAVSSRSVIYLHLPFADWSVHA